MCNGNAIMFPQTFRLQYPLAECPTHSYPSAFISRFIVDTLMLSCSANTSLEIRIFVCTNISISFLRSVTLVFFRGSFFVFRGSFFDFRDSIFLNAFYCTLMYFGLFVVVHSHQQYFTHISLQRMCIFSLYITFFYRIIGLLVTFFYRIRGQRYSKKLTSARFISKFIEFSFEANASPRYLFFCTIRLPISPPPHEGFKRSLFVPFRVK